MAYTGLGINGEAGEVAEVIKKWMRDDDGEIILLDKDKLTKELGDVLWYAARIATEADLSLNDVAEANLRKLRARKENDTLHGSGDDR